MILGINEALERLDIIQVKIPTYKIHFAICAINEPTLLSPVKSILISPRASDNVASPTKSLRAIFNIVVAVSSEKFAMFDANSTVESTLASSAKAASVNAIKIQNTKIKTKIHSYFR